MPVYPFAFAISIPPRESHQLVGLDRLGASATTSSGLRRLRSDYDLGRTDRVLVVVSAGNHRTRDGMAGRDHGATLRADDSHAVIWCNEAHLRSTKYARSPVSHSVRQRLTEDSRHEDTPGTGSSNSAVRHFYTW
jgi:hypothetical protein